MTHLRVGLVLGICLPGLGCGDAPTPSAPNEAARDLGDAAAPVASDAGNSQSMAQGQADAPIAMEAQYDCPEANAPIAGKIVDPEALLASAGPHTIEIMLVRSADLTAFNQIKCTTRPCPELEAEGARVAAENRKLQRCLRAWIDEAGATASDETFFLVNFIVAQATWEQARLIAAHPDVFRVSPDTFSAPPP